MELDKSIGNVKKIGSKSPLSKFLFHPIKYSIATIYRIFIFPFTKKPMQVEAKIFFGKKIHLALPAGTDIYLTGGKTHHSEIRLAKYLIQNLRVGDCFYDIGAHFGYFSMIASEIVGHTGAVHSFEPTPSTFSILVGNAIQYIQMTVQNIAVSDHNGHLVFYQFPNLYSEYNSFDITQFKGQPWINKFPPVQIEVATKTIDSLIQENKKVPNIIKIDVEGAEHLVIAGAEKTLINHSPILIMEYLCSNRHNQSHKNAEQALRNLGYRSYVINEDGALQQIEDINEYLNQNKLDSDNIVFAK